MCEGLQYIEVHTEFAKSKQISRSCGIINIRRVPRYRCVEKKRD